MYVTHQPEIRFKDIDLAGHVHNSQYLVYFEQARIAFFDDVIGPWDWRALGLVIARNEIDYVAPLHLRDDAYTQCWLEKMGTKSFTLGYRIYKREGDANTTCATGKSVQVCMNYETKVTHAIPMEWREKFQSRLKEVPE